MRKQKTIKCYDGTKIKFMASLGSEDTFRIQRVFVNDKLFYEHYLNTVKLDILGPCPDDDFEDIKYMFVTFVDDDETNNGITFMITLNTGEVSVV